MGFEIPTHYSHSLTTLSGPVISFLGKIKFQSVTLIQPRHRTQDSRLRRISIWSRQSNVLYNSKIISHLLFIYLHCQLRQLIFDSKREHHRLHGVFTALNKR